MHKPDRKMKAQAWLRSERSHFKREIYGIVCVSVLQFIVHIAALYQLAYVLSVMVANERYANASDMVILMAFFVAKFLLSQLVQGQKRCLSSKVENKYNTDLNNTLKTRSLALIHQYSTATWQSFYLRRIPSLQAFFQDYLTQQYLAGLAPIIVLAVTLPHSWLVALVLAVSAPLVPIFMWIVGMGAAAVHRDQFRAIERLSSIFLNRLNARQLLHIYKQVSAEKVFFDDAAIALKQRTLKVVRLAFLSSSVLDFFSTIAMALVAVFVGFTLLGELDFGAWSGALNLHISLFLLMLTPAFFKELKILGRYYHTKAEAVGAAEDLMGVLLASKDAHRSSVSEPAIEFNQLPLAVKDLRVYGNEQGIDSCLLLSAENLSLDIGERVLFKGASGSGKSSLLEGLLGLRPNSVNGGKIALDANSVGWITQSPVVLPDSVRGNLCLGTTFSDTQLLQALDAVELDAWLEQLPAGLDTEMGDYPPLSGGQRHRLAIARLLLFDMPIIFLDEPTANLCEQQKQRIESLIESTFKQKTLIWISHDRYDCEFFTTVWTLDDKRRLYQGTQHMIGEKRA